MKQRTIKKIHKIYQIYMSVISVLFGLSFIVCLGYIYFTGPLFDSNSLRGQTYEPELVKICCTYLLIPFILEIVSIVAGTIFFAIHPVKINEMAKTKPLTIHSKIKRYNIDTFESEKNKNTFKTLKYWDIAVVFISAIIVTFCSIITIMYLFQKENYVLNDHIIQQNIDLVLKVLPYVIIGLLWGIVAFLIRDKIAERKINILKEEKLFKVERKLIKQPHDERKNFISFTAIGILVGIICASIVIGFFMNFDLIPIIVIIAAIIVAIVLLVTFSKKEKKPSIEKPINEKRYIKNENIFIWIVRAIIFVVAVTFIILGVFNNGMKEVFVKAINICTECIGLG